MRMSSTEPYQCGQNSLVCLYVVIVVPVLSSDILLNSNTTEPRKCAQGVMLKLYYLVIFMENTIVRSNA